MIGRSNVSGGGGSKGEYVWLKRGMSEEVEEIAKTGTLTLTNETTSSIELEYSTTAPAYNSQTKCWEFANPTVITLTNSNSSLPTVGGNFYCRPTTDKHLWYLATGFACGSSAPYTKTLSYSKTFEANANEDTEFVIGKTEDAFPDPGWKGGEYYDRFYCNISKPTSWSSIKSKVSSSITTISDMIHNNGLTLLATDKGIFYSSDCGLTWTQSNITNSTSRLFYADGVYNASVSGGYMTYYSLDGKTWTVSNMSDYAEIAYGNGVRIARVDGSGSRCTVYYSADGKVWTASDKSDTTIKFTKFKYGGGVWGAKDNNSFYTSIDNGKTWTYNSINGIETNARINDFDYSDGLWVVGGSSTNGVKVMNLYYSLDCVTWTATNLANINLNSIKALNGKWVASAKYYLDSNYELYSSPDGKNWNKCDTSMATKYARIIENEGGIWFATPYNTISDSVAALYSLDGNTWSVAITDNIDIAPPFARYAGGVWAFYKKTSTNGIVWSGNVLDNKAKEMIYAKNVWLIATVTNLYRGKLKVALTGLAA